MPRYRNDNTGDVVTYDEPNPRLETLDNWQRLDEPAPEPPKPEPVKRAPRKS